MQKIPCSLVSVKLLQESIVGTSITRVSQLAKYMFMLIVIYLPPSPGTVKIKIILNVTVHCFRYCT
jgi:hypothetical protein